MRDVNLTEDLYSPPTVFNKIRVWHFLLCFGIAILGIGGISAATQGTLSAGYDEITIGVAGMVSILGWITWAKFRQGLSLTALFGSPPKTVQAWSLVVVGSLSCQLATLADLNLIIPFVEQITPAWFADFYTMSVGQPPETIPKILLGILTGVAFVGVFEEVIFRGLIFQRWAYAWDRPVVALLASSVLFAAPHGLTLNSFTFALICTFLYVYTSSLWAPIAMHMLMNGIVLTGWEPVESAIVSVGIAGRQEFGWTCLIASVVLLAGLVWYNGRSLYESIPYAVNKKKSG